jgi:hypothetical protein
MSKLTEVLDEASTRLLRLNAPPVNLTGKVVIAYDENDLLDVLKGVRSYPAVGIVYEGMRSMSEGGPTARVGMSGEIVLGLVLVERGDEVHNTLQKKVRAIEYLDAMRFQFIGQRSTVTNHFWHFMVEAPAALRSGAVCWVQRWSLPVQMVHSEGSPTTPPRHPFYDPACK